MPTPAKRNGPGLASLIREAGQRAREATAQADQVPSPTITEVPGQDGVMVPVMPTPPRRIRPQRIFSILDYIESSWGLGMRLYPVQRFLVKLYYFLPLNTRDRNIEISDMFNQQIVYRFTEAEYLQFLYKEGRCNI